MHTTYSTKERLERRLMEVVDQYRSMILDPVEQEVGDSPNWSFLRNRLLKALGEKGIIGRIREVLAEEFAKQEVGHGK